MIITLLRKPLEGSVADNVLKHGCGALNIDATRVEGEPWKWGTQTDIRSGGFGSKRPSDGNILKKMLKEVLTVGGLLTLFLSIRRVVFLKVKIGLV